jgi:Tfp pilus assembly protein PilX
MFTRFHRLRRGDDGVALVMAMSIVGIAGVLIVTLVGIALSQNRSSSNSRSRAASITTAEGAVDAALAAIQSAALATVPCGPQPATTVAGSAPDTITITTQVTFFNSAGNPLVCPLNEDVSVAADLAYRVLVKSVATTTPKGGGIPVRRQFESLAALKPSYSTDLNKAIFGNAGIQVANNFDLYGQNGPDADVYTNGNFSCANNEHYRGSVVAPLGSISVSGSCLIDVNAYAKTGFTSSGTVSGDVKVSAGGVAAGGTLGGKAYVTASSAWCTANTTKCTVTSPVRIPAAQTFPILNGTAAVLAQYTAQGYTSPVVLNNCDESQVGSVGRWLEDNAEDATTPVLLTTTCRVHVRGSTIKLNQNVAIFADRGFELSNQVNLQSKVTGEKHEILFIHPYDFQSRVSTVACNNNTLGDKNQTLNTGIALSNLVNMTPDISEFLYTPCDVQKANQSDVYGQVYAGGMANITNKTDAYYRPVSVIGVSVTPVVEFYNADILYKRESSS